VETFSLNVNGTVHEVAAEPEEPLLWVLRDQLGLTGTKFGCGEASCGVCSVLVDDEAQRSCVVSVGEVADGQRIVTIEGLGTDDHLTPLQTAFIEQTAFGCGFCTPGMIITATALLRANPNPTRRQIIDFMNDNLCRCAAYPAIIEAIEAAAARERHDD